MNERLFCSGRMKEFDKVVLESNIDKIATIYLELDAAESHDEALKNAKIIIKRKRGIT